MKYATKADLKTLEHAVVRNGRMYRRNMARNIGKLEKKYSTLLSKALRRGDSLIYRLGNIVSSKKHYAKVRHPEREARKDARIAVLERKVAALEEKRGGLIVQMPRQNIN